jgi:hypothetical protein
MKPAAGRLILTALLFVGWLGYLGYLVATRPVTGDGRPLVLSRPQALVSDLDVVAHVEGVDRPVVIREVLYQATGKKLAAGDEIQVQNLVHCRGFSGAGEYLLLLRSMGKEGPPYEVAPTPPSPGYSGDLSPPLVYPAPAILPQYRQVRKP